MHIRKDLPPRNRRRFALGTTQAQTLCGAEPTSYDYSRADGAGLARRPDDRRPLCARCAAILRAGG
jgi:hypothetical protein